MIAAHVLSTENPTMRRHLPRLRLYTLGTGQDSKRQHKGNSNADAFPTTVLEHSYKEGEISSSHYPHRVTDPPLRPT